MASGLNIYINWRISSMFAVVAVATFLIPLASSSQLTFGFRCNSSAACPEGSSCVEYSCFDCKVYPIKCLRSVEVCNGLGCGKGEDCYLLQEADDSGQTVTVKPTCAKTNPCSQMSCPPPGWCSNLVYGNQPPIAKCEGVVEGTDNPCLNHTCGEGQQCYAKTSFAYGLPSSREAACADTSACKSCSYLEYCELQEQPDGTVKGLCLGYFRYFGNLNYFARPLSIDFPPV